MPYTAADLQVIDPVALVRRRPEMFLPGGCADGLTLAQQVLGDVLAPSESEAVVRRSGGWWLIAADRDWLGEAPSATVEELFARMVASPEKGVNRCRVEVLLTAFAQDVVVWREGRCTVIQGQAAPCELLSAVAAGPPPRPCVVAFRLPDPPGERS